MLAGSGIKVPSVVGNSVGSATAQLQAAGFSVSVAGGTVPSSVPAGRVAYTSPSAYSRVDPGTTITIYVSDGSGSSGTTKKHKKIGGAGGHATPPPKPTPTATHTRVPIPPPTVPASPPPSH